MLKKTILIVVNVCFWSEQAIATDATWLCAVLTKKDEKQTVLKFGVKDNELIDFNIWYEGKVYLKYKILEDTDKALVAVQTERQKEGMFVRALAIDKVSGNFRDMSFSTYRDQTFDFNGTCYVSK